MQLNISQSLHDFLQPKGIKELVDEIIEATANFVYGNVEGATGNASVIGKHFNINNVINYEYEALNPVYAAWKKKKYGKKPILVRTGAMKKSSLDAKTTRIGPGKFMIEAKDPVTYAKYHEVGNNKLPKRAVWTMNTKDRKETRKFAQQVLNDKVGNLAFISGTDRKEVI